MDDNEEAVTLYPISIGKKKKKNHYNNNYRIQKSNPNNQFYIITLLIISVIQFLIIINLYFNSNSKSYNNTKEIYNETKETNKTDVLNEKEKDIKEQKNNEKNKDNIKLVELKYKKEKRDTDKLQIHIAMACDNGAIYSTLVSMASALENNNKADNILVYHLLLSNDFNMEKFSCFESLKEKYDFILNYIKIPPIFKYINKRWTGTETVEYKLLLSLIYPEIPRIIFLDGDTLVFTDISVI